MNLELDDLLGDNLGDVDRSSRGSGVKGHSRGRGGESSNGGDGELHFDDVGLVVVVWRKKAKDYIIGLVAEASVRPKSKLD
jgi:hypothetical protein